MDPLSALSVASSVVQFVDYTSKLISGAHQLGTKSLIQTSDDFKHSLAKGKTRGLSSNERDLQSLCEECQQVADDLLAVLKRLKAQENKGKWSNILQAIKSIWSQEQIDSLQKRLDGFRQQLIIAILVALR
jgi:hypothetical protein